MPQKPPLKKQRRSESTKAKTQQRNRLKKSLFRNAAKYSIECESDVFVMIRIRKNGQRFTFDSSASDHWLPSMPELDEYFPAPIKETLKDIISGFDGHPFLDRQESETTCRSSAEKDDDTSTPPT
ncbi:hypothetical protein BDV41DRAFT_543363 [Aspergillus transmontanensis]|uniref:MADS-box domain-containing protein n=1 Tax=Aspergillus transmontanensis TaxID=1034304 RepID=A0A5N6VRS1_9EURO|nr:hypothetical protein BDV41DRAFT_543363 [Aspergillus transmontanensis]